MSKYVHIALAGLVLGLSACAKKDDFMDHLGGGSDTGKYTINLDSARLAGPDPVLGATMRVGITAEAGDEELRAMGIEWVERTGTDYKGDAYENEVKPHLIFTKPDGADFATVNVFLTMVKVVGGQPDPNSVFSQNVVFKVEGATDANGRHSSTGNKYRLSYFGEIAMPTNYQKFGGESTDQWYIMGMMGATPSKDMQSYSVVPRAVWGRRSEDDTDRNSFQSMSSQSFPYASNWVPLTVKRDQTSNRLIGLTDATAGNQMRFKPLGVFLQVDLGAPILTYFETKVDLFVSNAVDFYGDYNFSPAEVVKAFSQKDATGVGIPQFVSDVNKYTDLVLGDFSDIANATRLYSDLGASSPLSSANRSFPWDMPSVQNSLQWNTRDLANTDLKTLTQGSPDQGTLYYIFHRPDLSASGRTWEPNRNHGIGLTDRSIVWYWARPKDVAPAEPYTYMYKSYYPKEGGNQTRGAFPTPDNFNPRRRVYDVYDRLIGVLADVNFAEGNLNLYKRKEAELRAAGDTSSPTYQYVKANMDAYQKTYDELVVEYNSVRTPAYIADSTKFWSDYIKRYAAHEDFRAQQVVPIYQTNYSFHQGGAPLRGTVVHLHGLMVNDLTISEVHYHKENGVNYSAVEISNRSNLRLNLSNYALVRMRENAAGDGFAFVKEDGSLTDRVTEAQIYPFEAIRRNQSAPLTGFPAFAAANTRSFATSKRRIVNGMGLEAPANASFAGRQSGEYAGMRYSIANIEDIFMPGNPLTLSNGQTFVFGASGYNREPVTDAMAWWTADYKDVLWSRFRNDNTLHAFVGYDDAPAGGNATLDMEVGDAFALIKKTDSDGGWQIIDATGPIGSKGYAFSGTYADYKQELANKGITSTTTRYSMYRDEEVIFPFIFPYRTRKMTTNWSDDWTIEADTPGKLGQYLSVYQNIIGYNTLAYLKRTPWSPDSKWIEIYKRNRPVHK